ncbi:MAG: Rho termination factor N-terminal domain-containing protein [Bacilli bacterium]|nr:Rho termination factor N-terminal domain-containing protein [Bacilli bacterium]
MIDFLTDEDKNKAVIKEQHAATLKAEVEHTAKEVEKVVEKVEEAEPVKKVVKEEVVEVKKEAKVAKKATVKKEVEAKPVKKETIKKEKAEKIDLSKLTVVELKAMAKDKNIEGYTKLKKDELLKALK